MGQVKNGDKVKIHYTGKLEDGHVFDSSQNRPPLDFIVGNGDIMLDIEQGIIGMEIGETKIIEIPPENAFGQRRDDLVVDVPKSDIPEDFTPTIGQALKIRQPDGKVIAVSIVDSNEHTVTLDANHPLAGHTLFINVELVEIS